MACCLNGVTIKFHSFIHYIIMMVWISSICKINLQIIPMYSRQDFLALMFNAMLPALCMRLKFEARYSPTNIEPLRYVVLNNCNHMKSDPVCNGFHRYACMTHKFLCWVQTDPGLHWAVVALMHSPRVKNTSGNCSMPLPSPGGMWP